MTSNAESNTEEIPGIASTLVCVNSHSWHINISIIGLAAFLPDNYREPDCSKDYRRVDTSEVPRKDTPAALVRNKGPVAFLDRHKVAGIPVPGVYIHTDNHRLVRDMPALVIGVAAPVPQSVPDPAGPDPVADKVIPASFQKNPAEDFACLADNRVPARYT